MLDSGLLRLLDLAQEVCPTLPFGGVEFVRIRMESRVLLVARLVFTSRLDVQQLYCAHCLDERIELDRLHTREVLPALPLDVKLPGI